MSRHEDLRRMREAKFTREQNAVPVRQSPITKPFPNSVTKPSSVTKPKDGRPTIGDKPMTAAERMRRYRARQHA
jgi:hypothetical protein